MICPNCNFQNIDGTKFCVKCGTQFNNSAGLTNNQNFVQLGQQPINNMASNLEPVNNITNNVNLTDNNISSIQNIGVTTQNATLYHSPNTTNDASSTLPNIKMSILEYFFILLAVILKPFTAFKEELHKFDKFKNSAILSLIVVVFATGINLIKTMYRTVRVTTFNWSSYSNETSWQWENLKNIKYIKEIGMNLLLYLGIILAITCVYYIASLIVKKQVNFSRLLGISTICVVPIILCTMIISPLLTMIYAPLGIGITIIGGVYSFIILYETINNEILLDGNIKYYFNLVCLSILIIAGYYLYMKLFLSSATGGLNDLLNLFS